MAFFCCEPECEPLRCSRKCSSWALGLHEDDGCVVGVPSPSGSVCAGASAFGRGADGVCCLAGAGAAAADAAPSSAVEAHEAQQAQAHEAQQAQAHEAQQAQHAQAHEAQHAQQLAQAQAQVGDAAIDGAPMSLEDWPVPLTPSAPTCDLWAHATRKADYDRVAALEDEIAALKGKCDRCKQHLGSADWMCGVYRDNYKRLSRTWQSEYQNNCVKFVRLQNEADVAKRREKEVTEINRDLLRRNQQLRDERDALQNALLKTQCGQARRAAERSRARATSDPMDPLEAA